MIAPRKPSVPRWVTAIACGDQRVAITAGPRTASSAPAAIIDSGAIRKKLAGIESGGA